MTLEERKENLQRLLADVENALAEEAEAISIDSEEVDNSSNKGKEKDGK